MHAQNSSFGHLGIPKQVLIRRCWASFGSRRMAFSFCLSRKCNFRALWECSRWPFPPCLSRNRCCQGSPRMPKSGPLRMMDVSFDHSRLLFPLLVEDKSRLGLPGNAHDRLFPLPVEELVISGLPCESKQLSFSDGSGCQPAFVPSDSPSSSRQIRAA